MKITINIDDNNSTEEGKQCCASAVIDKLKYASFGNTKERALSALLKEITKEGSL